MATVNEVALKYSAKGARAARREDRKVRDSVQETAKTAQKESGTINRWMDRHKRAIQTIGVATAAVMGSILAASPTMRAELAGIRTAFSLLADTIVRDVLPAGTSLVDLAFRLVDAYQGLPGPVRTVLSHLVAIGGVVITLLAAFKGLAAILAPLATVFTLVAKAAAVVGGAIAAVGAGTAALIAAVAVAVVAVVAFVVALITNFKGARDKTKAILGDAASWIRDTFSALADAAWRWGADIIDRLAAGITDKLHKVRAAASRARGEITSRLSFDLARNDRAARRWGSDLMEEWATGANRNSDAIGQAVPSPAPGTGGGGGSSTSVVFEEGAIQVDGAGSPKRTAENTAEEVSRKIQDDFSSQR